MITTHKNMEKNFKKKIIKQVATHITELFDCSKQSIFNNSMQNMKSASNIKMMIKMHQGFKK